MAFFSLKKYQFNCIIKNDEVKIHEYRKIRNRKKV